MTRVRAVVKMSIMVHMHDVVPGDVLNISNNEDDPIIERIERDGDLTRFFYKPNIWLRVDSTQWMDPNDRYTGNGCVWIHDLKRERFEFLEQEGAA